MLGEFLLSREFTTFLDKMNNDSSLIWEGILLFFDLMTNNWKLTDTIHYQQNLKIFFKFSRTSRFWNVFTYVCLCWGFNAFRVSSRDCPTLIFVLLNTYRLRTEQKLWRLPSKCWILIRTDLSQRRNLSRWFQR